MGIVGTKLSLSDWWNIFFITVEGTKLWNYKKFTSIDMLATLPGSVLEDLGYVDECEIHFFHP